MTYIKKYLIKKRNGEKITVSKETGEKIIEGLSSATQHLFLKITELGIMLNSADIEEVAPIKETIPDVDQEEEITPEQREKNLEKLDTIRKDLSHILQRHD